MIRNLAPDEVVWFIGRSLAYLGHSDPQGLSLRLGSLLKDPRLDGDDCFVLTRPGRAPSAGVHLRAPDPGGDVLKLELASPWHDGDAEGLQELVADLLARHPHEAAILPLFSLSGRHASELGTLLAPLGFVHDERRRLRFELSEVPPIGSPLVLDAWSLDQDIAFKECYERCEGEAISDKRWAFLKRRHGPFTPNLWFVARETLDQESVGYALCGSTQRRLDAEYSLDGIGVRQDLRGDSRMLRRLVISTLHELSTLSPLGMVYAELSSSDPNLIKILRSVGFVELQRTPVLVKEPR